MRDPNRIPKMMAVLLEYWAANPDLRLGQIIDNACRINHTYNNYDVFYVEDEKLFDGLNRFVELQKQNAPKT